MRAELFHNFLRVLELLRGEEGVVKYPVVLLSELMLASHEVNRRV